MKSQNCPRSFTKPRRSHQSYANTYVIDGMRCNASSLGMQRGNQGHRAKNGAHVARDAFSQRCDRTDGAVERRGELQRPCRFPIKQMPAGNSSNPSSQACFVYLSLADGLSFFVQPQKGNRRSARVEQHAKFESRLVTHQCMRLHTLYLSSLECVTRARIAAGPSRMLPHACNRLHVHGISN